MQQSLVAVFCTTHADSVGNSCRLQLLVELSKSFQLTIVTNQVAFIKGLFPSCKVAALPVTNAMLSRLPVVSKLVYARKIAKVLNRECVGKKLFVFHDTSDYVLYINKDIEVYTCVHQIHEFIGLAQRKGLSSLIIRMNGNVLYRGVKKSKVCFVNFETIADYLKGRGMKNEIIVTPHFIDRDVYGANAIESDISCRLREEKREGAFVMTYTGWVSENRGLTLMLETVKKLSQEKGVYKLCIVGCQDEYKSKIEEYAKQNQLEDKILVYGRIAYNLIPAILQESFVCLSFLEINPVYSVSPPQKVVEYFAAGKPVIANHIKTHEYLIEDGVTGFLCGDADSVAKAVISMSDSNELYSQLCANAKKESEKYDKKQIMNVYIREITE